MSEFLITLEPVPGDTVITQRIHGDKSAHIVWYWEVRNPETGQTLAHGWHSEEEQALEAAKEWANALSKKKTIVYEPPSSP